MWKKFILGGVACCGICWVNGMDAELRKFQDWTPIIGGMQFPKMAIDGTDERPEPEALRHYHVTRRGLMYRCFMPKNQDEMDLLYNAYKAGVFVPDLAGFSDPQYGWKNVLIDIDGELRSRFKTGDMFFINKFLDHLTTFVDLAVNHPDQDFIGTTLFDTEFIGLRGHLFDARPRLGKCPLSQENIRSILERFDVILRKTKNNGNYSILQSSMRLDSIDWSSVVRPDRTDN